MVSEREGGRERETHNTTAREGEREGGIRDATKVERHNKKERAESEGRRQANE